MLILVDKPMAEIAFRTARRASAETGRDPVERPEIVLIQDGVLLEPELDVPTYALQRDLEIRGVTPPETVEAISYDELGAMLFEQEVKTFV